MYILKKIAFNIQWDSKDIEKALYHHELVKILVEVELKANNDNWKYFLIRNHFVDNSDEENILKTRIIWRRISSNPNPKQEIKVSEDLVANNMIET